MKTDLILKVLEANGRASLEDIAAATGYTAQEVAARLDAYQKEGIINGYRAIIDYDKANVNRVQALIDVSVKPKKNHGFDEIAEMIAHLEEVDTVLLMSGGYDLSVVMSGKSFQDIALFVAKRLSPMDDVVSTATHFVLKTYKKDGHLFGGELKDERGLTTL
ncbi:MAG: Lrp/AsnC family transcriptional regulator [Oscillospiraceae bacterium]|nr:Lrp/AsnC family transcriptional regulator [Oscillospiraceae bacterium]